MNVEGIPSTNCESICGDGLLVEKRMNFLAKVSKYQVLVSHQYVSELVVMEK